LGEGGGKHFGVLKALANRGLLGDGEGDRGETATGEEGRDRGLKGPGKQGAEGRVKRKGLWIRKQVMRCILYQEDHVGTAATA
jgi:hypothetical protein